MTTQELQRKLQRIILDLEELEDDESINEKARNDIDIALNRLRCIKL